MSSLRQFVFDHLGGDQESAARGAAERRAGHDRRAVERRSKVYPFETRENRLRFAAQAAGFGIYDLDCISGESSWSPELKAMLGLTQDPAPLSTEQVEAFVHPDDRQRVLEKFGAALDPAGDGVFEDEHRLVRPDGRTIWIRVKGRTFFVGEGESRHPLAATGVVMDITASRAAEQALAESREELDKLVASAIDSIITVDADQRIIRFNPSASRMFGCPAEEAIGSSLERFMPERFRATHAEKVRRFAEGEAPAQALDSPRRFSALRASGEEFPFEATVTRINVDGRSRMTTFMRDISDRVKTEEALRRSKEYLEMAVRGADIGIWHWHLADGGMELSERCRQLFGIPAGEAANYERVLAAIHPDDREGVELALRRATEKKEEYNFEKRFIWPDGSIHWLACIGRNVYDESSGKAVGVSGISIDVTERKLQDEALRHSKDDLELAVRGGNIGIWHWNLDSGEVIWSERTYELFGIPPGEPINFERVMAAVHPEDRQRVLATVEEALQKGGEAYNFDCRVIWPDGSIHWVSAIGRFLYNQASGKGESMRGVALDITERKRQEEILLGWKDELESSIAQRTAELVQANEALERSNLELQQFAFIAAHDLQTPLRSIAGFAHLLKEDYSGRFDHQADVWLSQIVRSARRMHELVQDLLSYSRVESRGSIFEPIDCNRIFDDIVEILDVPIKETGARVSRDQLPVVTGDRTQLAQVLQNLIDNALKYRGVEPPRIHVSAARRDGEWVFSVRDNGIGMDDKHLDQIFDIFRRLHTQDKYPGTGIGLAICRRVIHRHGGRIWVESEPGRGSVFYFSLPDRGPTAP